MTEKIPIEIHPLRCAKMSEIVNKLNFKSNEIDRLWSHWVKKDNFEFGEIQSMSKFISILEQVLRAPDRCWTNEEYDKRIKMLIIAQNLQKQQPPIYVEMDFKSPLTYY